MFNNRKEEKKNEYSHLSKQKKTKKRINKIK